MTVFTAALAVFVALGAVLLLVGVRCLPAPRAQPELHRLPDFTIASYRPVHRLLDDADIAFLRTQRGYSAEIERTFLRHRRNVLRLYLIELAHDFRVLHRAARELALHDASGPDLAWLLMRQSAQFWRLYVGIRLRLCLPFGSTVPSRERFAALLDAAQWMRGQIPVAEGFTF
ncbi:MAG: hypothetical protein R2762_21340 [Bryobacteraceae bacterium]